MKNVKFLFLLAFGLSLMIHNAYAQWSSDPKVNTPICVSSTQQNSSRIVSDGKGGAIITWWDYNSVSNDYNIYAQRINSQGIVKWTTDGIPICTNPTLQHVPEMVSDGKGGAIITWFDQRNVNDDIYAQRIDSNGIALWAGNGVVVCDTIKDQASPKLLSDGNGGAFITWEDMRDGTGYAPYVQKLSADGVVQWTKNGVALTNGYGDAVQIVSDGNGGAIITWQVYTGNYPNGNHDIFAQQINSVGVPGWGQSGIAICSLTSTQLRPQIISDGSNGAIIVWEDFRNNTSISNMYAQKVNAAGAFQWATDGVVIAQIALTQRNYKLLSDGSGGAYITWQYSNNLIYAQRIDASGVKQWAAADGIAIGTKDAYYPQIASDGDTGAIITWYDYRGSGNGDIYAQRINLEGTTLWTVEGVAVCNIISAAQTDPQLIENGKGGVIICWTDDRNSSVTMSDIYAQLVNGDGTLGIKTGINSPHAFDRDLIILQNYPNPFSSKTKISWKSPINTEHTLKIYDILGKEVATLMNENKPAGSYEYDFDASKLKGGIYFCKLMIGSNVVTKKMTLLR